MSSKDEIRCRRESKKLSQRELADIMGVTKTAVTNWETGVAMPRAGDLPRLADALGCSIDALFGREQKEDST